MRYFIDIRGREIRLTDERIIHLETEHPEMSGQMDRISETIHFPDKIVRSKTDSSVELFYRHYQTTPVTEKFLCIVVKVANDDPFIVTAYYTDSLKRGESLWEKK
jgi:hypothetical protein